MEPRTVTRYQAIRSAIEELGPTATIPEIAEHVKTHYHLDVSDPTKLAVFVSMVNRKMTRKPRGGGMPASVCKAAVRT